jgi:hypothetical protein
MSFSADGYKCSRHMCREFSLPDYDIRNEKTGEEEKREEQE